MPHTPALHSISPPRHRGIRCPLVRRAMLDRRSREAYCAQRAAKLGGEPMQRSDVTFQSDGTRCAAWLYRPVPSGGGPAPCVVLAHGFSAVRDQRLDAYAERFLQAGLTALL